MTLSLDDAELVPIVVKVQSLQGALLEKPDAFSVAAWNYWMPTPA